MSKNKLKFPETSKAIFTLTTCCDGDFYIHGDNIIDMNKIHDNGEIKVLSTGIVDVKKGVDYSVNAKNGTLKAELIE